MILCIAARVLYCYSCVVTIYCCSKNIMINMDSDSVIVPRNVPMGCKPPLQMMSDALLSYDVTISDSVLVLCMF